jgi:DNA ligase (NAD+)
MDIRLSREYLEELYLKLVAEKLNLDLEKAAKSIDHCLKKLAFEKKLEVSDVYALVYSVEHISRCLPRKSLKGLSEKECSDQCSTVWFEEECHPRFFEDVEEINRDPDLYLQKKKFTVDQLQKFLRLASYLYFNFEGGGLTNNSFDSFEHHLKTKFKTKIKKEELKTIGSLPVEKLREKLPYQMGSLQKVKPGDKNLELYVAGPLEWSVKEDGVSALIIFSKGSPSKIFSRGDGIIGGNITYLKEFLDLPTPQEYPDIVVRGELVVSRKNFEEKYSKLYSISRAFVTSKVNSGFVNSSLQDIKFVAYEVVDLRTKKATSLSNFEILELEGFETAVNGKIQDPTVFQLVTEYKKQRVGSPYDIDGLVIAPLNGSLPKIAFKMLLEEQIRWTKVLKIDWNPSRTGRLIPRITYEAVYFAGKRHTHATGHNAAHIRDWELKSGSRIKIVLSGDIIPEVRDVKPPESIFGSEESVYPPENWGWEWIGKDIVLKDPDSNIKVQQARIVYFLKTIGVRGIKEGWVEKYHEKGIKTVTELYAMKLDEIKNIKGLGGKRGETQFSDLHATLQKTRFDRLVAAIGTIKGMGRVLIKAVIRHIPNLFTEPPSDLKRELDKVKIPGIAAKRKKALLEGVPMVLDFFKNISGPDFQIALANEKKRIQSLLTGKKNSKIDKGVFVFTGFMQIDFDLEDYIYDNGGDISSTVISSTRCVICKSPTEITKKSTLASELGVPILTLGEFFRKFGLPFSVEEIDDIEIF